MLNKILRINLYYKNKNAYSARIRHKIYRLLYVITDKNDFYILYRFNENDFLKLKTIEKTFS